MARISDAGSDISEPETLQDQLLKLKQRRDGAAAKSARAALQSMMVQEYVKVSSGNKSARKAVQAREMLRQREDSTVELRIAYGKLCSQSAQREAKLNQLRNELQLLEEEARTRPAELRQFAENESRHQTLEAEVEGVEQILGEQEEYTSTLNRMKQRLEEEKGGGAELLLAVRESLKDVAAEEQRLTIEANSMQHEAWQARNAMKLQLELYGGQVAAQRKLSARRGNIIEAQGQLEEEEKKRQEEKEARERQINLTVLCAARRERARPHVRLRCRTSKPFGRAAGSVWCDVHGALAMRARSCPVRFRRPPSMTWTRKYASQGPGRRRRD